MIIDSHTHIFPDKIAEKTVSYLESQLPDPYVAHGTGFADDLSARAKEADIDYALVLPVVTAPRQFDSINRFAAEINGKGNLLSFGGIHPDNDRIEERLQEIKAMGLKGIKLHPDYQHCYIDDDRYLRILKECARLGLKAVIHAGVDVGFPDPVHCPPLRTARLLDRLYEGNEPEIPDIILAHAGGNDMYDDVLTYLAGRSVFFDLAFCADKMPAQTLLTIIRTHGADKILFASDYPWADLKTHKNYVASLPLTEEEKEQILWKNANTFLHVVE